MGGLVFVCAKFGAFIMPRLCVITYNVKVIKAILFGRGQIGKNYVDPSVARMIDLI